MVLCELTRDFHQVRSLVFKWVGMPGLGSRLGSTYWQTKWSNEWRCSRHISDDQTPIPCVLVELPGLKPKGIVV